MFLRTILKQTGKEWRTTRSLFVEINCFQNNLREKYKHIFSLQILGNSYIYSIVLSGKVSSHYPSFPLTAEAACVWKKHAKLPQLLLITKVLFQPHYINILKKIILTCNCFLKVLMIEHIPGFIIFILPQGKLYV